MFALFKKPSFGLKLVLHFLLLITWQKPSQIEAQPQPEVIHGYTIDQLYQKLMAIKEERDKDGPAFTPSNPLVACVRFALLSGICTEQRRGMILLQVALELRYDTHSAPCQNTAASRQFRNPPPLHGDRMASNNQEYADWQSTLLSSNERFCHPHKNLHCSAASNVCECVAVSEWSPAAETCVVKAAQSCALDPPVLAESGGKVPVYYNPLSPLSCCSEAIWTEPPPKLCLVPGHSCFRPAYFLDPFCMSDALALRPQATAGNFKRFLTRAHGQDCDPADQDFLLSVAPAQRLNFEPRWTQLANFLGGRHFFCNPAEFLTCSAAADGGKCDGMTPTIFNSTLNSCTLPPPHDQCGKFKDIEGVKNASLVHEAKEAFALAFENHAASCEGPFRGCFVDDDHVTHLMEMDCTCPAGKAGLNCDVPLTRFLTRVRPTTFPADVPRLADKWHAFFLMNANARRFESVNRREEGSFPEKSCPMITEARGRRAERLIRSLNTVSRTTRLTQAYYDAIIDSTAFAPFYFSDMDFGLCNLASNTKCVLNGSRFGVCRSNVSLSDLAAPMLRGVDKLPCGAPCDPTVPSTAAEFNSIERIERLEDLLVTRVGDKFCGSEEDFGASAAPCAVAPNGSWHCFCGGGSRGGSGGRNSLNVHLGRAQLILVFLLPIFGSGTGTGNALTGTGTGLI